ncbi:MAG TPA: EAL domain-containing protein, partial [Acidimicrobiales bacterium]
TGLPNRGLFTDRLENALAIAGRQGNGLAVVLLDLDRFKDINDALGHASGDEILCELAQRLRHRLRAGDTVARLGGDEFGFLLPAVASDADAVAVAADMQELLDEPFMVNGMAVHLAASFGVACHPDHGLDAGELVRHAGVAMYAAKATNTVIEVYGPQFDPHSAERLELAAEVRRALDEDELELWYQPKMDLVDGHIVGVEALLRWNHPTRGIVAPGLFMPVVETTELVRAVTAFVLKEAVAQCSRWKLDGRDLTVAVNLPARNAHDLRLPGQVADLLASHHLPASALECELTESAVLDHPDRARQVLSELDRLGVHLSIDDFGTGYASVAYLTDLPIHALKIDQSFVRDVLGGGDGGAIVRFSTDLARMLGLQVVAEGVESREVLAAVADLGCDLAQGYLLTEPIPAAELEAWLDAFDPQTLTLPRESAPA